jgi:ferric-dicitrate binding protein FerR (iron transport regulator)
MNRDELSKLIDQYRDGTLAASDSPALLAAIRGADGDWILEQFALMNHINHAFDQVAPDAFVVSLFERMDADKSATRFVRDLAKRQQDKRKSSSLRLRQANVSKGRFGTAKSALWLCAAACLVIGIFWADRSSSTHPPSQVARVMRAQAAIIQHGDKITPARTAGIVHSGDRLVTNIGGRAHVRYADDSLLEMNGDARLRIEGDGNDKRIVLDSGDIYLTASHQLADASWSIRTRNGVVTVVGTELEVSSTAEHTRVRVVKGSVGFENAVNKIDLKAGEESQAMAGIRISEPVPADLSGIALWRTESVSPGSEISGLVGYWNMDETSGRIAADSSGRGNDCVLTGGTWVPGKIGNGLHFSGVTGQAVAQDFSLALHGLTVAAWVCNDRLPAALQRFVTVGGGQIACIRHDGKTKGVGGLDFFVDMAGEIEHLRIPDTFETSIWYHVAGTYDGAMQRLYVNGVLRESQELRGELPPAKLVSIGGKNEPMHGIIDEVRVYDRALTDSEIAALAR